MLHFLNYAFFVFHTGVILFNLVGWAFRRTRVLQRLTFGLTAFSWFVLGAYYGWGYCFCTDWHFAVRRQLGYHDAETSYVQLLIAKVLGITLTRPQADLLAFSVFMGIAVATIAVWIRDRRRRST